MEWANKPSGDKMLDCRERGRDGVYEFLVWCRITFSIVYSYPFITTLNYVMNQFIFWKSWMWTIGTHFEFVMYVFCNHMTRFAQIPILFAHMKG